MTVVSEFGQMVVEKAGLGFGVEFNGTGVEIEIEFPDYGARTSGIVCTRYATISREDWAKIVKYVGNEEAA